MFTIKDDGTPIAKTEKPKPVIISVVDNFDGKKKKGQMKEIETEKKIIPVPDITKRFTEYIAGPSGSGKSYMTANLADQYKNVYPHKPIYIFSRGDIEDDPAFSNLEYVQIPINEELLDNPIDIVEMAQETEDGCLFIFDDCGTIHDDKLRKAVEKLIVDILEVGRKYDVNIIVTNHLIIPNERKFARTIMNELSIMTIYPRCGSAQQIAYVLKTYWGLDKKKIAHILALNSRWVRISKTYPQYVLHEHGAYFL